MRPSTPPPAERAAQRSGVEIRLRTLGLTDLLDGDDTEISAVLAQPKRFALLTYLAAARPQGVQRRDRVLALFWPELNEARARDALNQALRFLRQALGADVLVRRSAEEVGVNPELLWCDVPAFRAAAEAERWDDAMSLYRGGFLQGFFVSGAEGFERWMEEERSALRRLAARGARELARRHEGDGALTQAITWGRRVLEITPNDERALRSLLGFHVRAGDHAGALHLYDSFARRLQEEWGTEPAPETRRIIEEVRSGHGGPIADAEVPDRHESTAPATPEAGGAGDGDLLGGRYRIERELGAGGNATVYLARDLKHDRDVAVKVLAPAITEGLARDRFLREIRIVSRLQHPGIVPLFDSGDAEGRLYYVMPVVSGETLRQRMRRGQMDPAEVLTVLREVAESLRYAHSQGVIHRDIKPENVLLVDGRALVTDFGIARATDAARASAGSDSGLTRAGTSLGTPAYMSPEQAAGDPQVSHLADLYSLGVLGYEMLAGRPPFTGDTPQEILAEKLTRAAPDLLEFRPDTPAWLAGLIMRCLERDPTRRPRTAGAMAAELAAERAAPRAAVSFTAGWVRRLRHLRARASRVSRRSWAAIALMAATLASAAVWSIAGADAEAGDPDLVAVLPFRVSGGDSALAEMREGVVDLAAIHLTGDQGPLRAVEPATLFRAWQTRTGDASRRELDDDEAVALARELGAGWLLRGSFLGTGGDVLLRASMVPVGGESAIHASVTGPADSLLAHVPRLLGRLVAQRYGITPDQSGSLTTNSLDAVRAYLVGRRHYRQGEYSLAVDRFTEALETDSSFALAALGLLMAHEWSGNAPQAMSTAATEIAWRNRERLRARDRALIEAILGPDGTGRSRLADVQAAREHAAIVAEDRFEAWYLLADHLFHFGALLGIDEPLARSEEAFQRSLALDPGQAGVLQHLIQIAAWRGDTAAVRARWADYRAAVPDPAVRFKEEWLVGQLLDDSALVRAALLHFDGGEAAHLGIYSLVTSVALFPELTGSLRELLERAEPAAQQRWQAEEFAELRWWLALDGGRPADAARALPYAGESLDRHEKLFDELFWSAPRVVGDRELALMNDELGVCGRGLLHAHEGRWDAVAEAVARLARFTGPAFDWFVRRQGRMCGRLLEAARAQGTGDPEAHRLVLSVDSLLLTVPYVQILWENLMVARLLEAEGEYSRAAAAAGRFRYGLGYPHYMSEYLREGGRLAALAGDRERAIERYTRYLALRSDPEPATADEVARVRSALDSLTAGPAAPGR